mgnify:CR=1 FL=1
MKSYTLLFLLLLLHLLPLTSYAQTPPLFDDIGKEYQINFKKQYPRIDSAHAIKKIKNFDDRIRRMDKKDQPICRSKNYIKVNDLIELYEKAKLSSSYRPSTKKQLITGLRVIYGLKENDSIQLFYAPWRMLVQKSLKNKLKGAVNDCDESTVYTYINNKFKSVSTDNAYFLDAIERFATKIEIQKFKNEGNFHEFFFSDSWKADALSAFFSFQQIDRIYQNSPTKDKDGKESKRLHFHEALVYKRKQTHGVSLLSFAKRRFKVTLLVSPLPYNSTKELIKEAGFSLRKEDGRYVAKQTFDNFAGLCPPSCNYFRYFIVSAK